VPESRVSLSDGVAGWIKRCGKPARLDDPSTLPALTQHRNGEWRTAIDRNVPHRFTISNIAFADTDDKAPLTNSTER
jgi:hypothetical protein